jgi:hypothetical protein
MALGALLLAPVRSSAQTVLGTQTLNLNLNGAGLIYSVPATTPLTNSGAVFSNYTGSISITYRARTTLTTGTGAITVQALSGDFSPAGGPTLASGTLKYTCSGATLGTNCSGTQTVSTASATNVVALPAAACTGGGSPCSTANPNTVTINFTLTNDPQYQTSASGYSATLTFTISAT